MVKNPSLMPGFRSLVGGDVNQRRKNVGEYIQGCWRSCYQAGNGMDEPTVPSVAKARPFIADCIIANPPSFAHIHCAEKLGIPLHIMFTMPYSPTQAFPHPLANIQSSADPQLTNYMSYAMIELLSWQGIGDIVNRFRPSVLGWIPLVWLMAPACSNVFKSRTPIAGLQPLYQNLETGALTCLSLGSISSPPMRTPQMLTSKHFLTPVQGASTEY